MNPERLYPSEADEKDEAARGDTLVDVPLVDTTIENTDLLAAPVEPRSNSRDASMDDTEPGVLAATASGRILTPKTYEALKGDMRRGDFAIDLSRSDAPEALDELFQAVQNREVNLHQPPDPAKPKAEQSGKDASEEADEWGEDTEENPPPTTIET